MENGRGNTDFMTNSQNLNKFFLYVKRKLKLNRFLLVIDTKKGVVISAITIIVVELIDLLWNLSMTFGPLNSTMTTLLLVETFLVICVSSVLLYAIKTDNKSDLRLILLLWLVVVAIDYALRATLNISSLIISEKASSTAKFMRLLATLVILVLVAHCWLCVFTYYDDNNGKIKYFWLKGPWLTLLATFAYLYLVLKAGPEFMRNRKAYDLKLTIRFYNLILVAINAYLFLGCFLSFRFGRDFWGCSEALNAKKRGTMLRWGHAFFHTRYLEFFDTFFFILRKKNQQISFLHVFHHAIVPTLMYIGLKFYPLPFNSLLPMTNMFVHIIMYAYYGLATFGPWMQPYLWWKKYLTTMQISQFAILIIHCTQPLLFYNRPECKFPLTMVFINFCIGLTFISLFISFYKQSYCKLNRGKSSAQSSVRNGDCNGTRRLLEHQSKTTIERRDTLKTE